MLLPVYWQRCLLDAMNLATWLPSEGKMDLTRLLSRVHPFCSSRQTASAGQTPMCAMQGVEVQCLPAVSGQPQKHTWHGEYGVGVRGTGGHVSPLLSHTHNIHSKARRYASDAVPPSGHRLSVPMHPCPLPCSPCPPPPASQQRLQTHTARVTDPHTQQDAVLQSSHSHRLRTGWAQW